MTVALDARVEVIAGLIARTAWGAENYGEFDHAAKRCMRTALHACPAVPTAVALLEAAPRFRFDAPYCWGLHHSPFPDFEPIAPPPDYATAGPRLTEAVRAVGRDPAVTTAVAEIVALHQPVLVTVAGWIAGADPVAWLRAALGPFPLRFEVILASQVDWHGHGGTLHGSAAYALLGVKGVGEGGTPIYGSAVDVPLVVCRAEGCARAERAAFTSAPRVCARLPEPGARERRPGQAAVQGLDLVYVEELLGPDALRQMEFKQTPGWDVLRARWRELLARRPVSLTEAGAVLREAW